VSVFLFKHLAQCWIHSSVSLFIDDQ
jgi:hypothetical protein